MSREKRQYNGAKIISSTNSAETMGYPQAKTKRKKNKNQKKNHKKPPPKQYLNLTTFTKANSKWFIDPNIMKLLEDNVGENLDDLAYGNDFLDIKPKAQSVKEIMDFIVIMKNLCSVKDNLKRIRRQAIDWKKILGIGKLYRGLLAQIYKEHLTLNNKKKNQSY